MLFLAPLLLRGKLAFLGLPGWLSGKESACQCRRHRFDPWVGEIPWRRKWQPTPVFLLGKFHGQRGAWWGPWGSKELDMTEPVSTGFSLDVFLLSPTFPTCGLASQTIMVSVRGLSISWKKKTQADLPGPPPQVLLESWNHLACCAQVAVNIGCYFCYLVTHLCSCDLEPSFHLWNSEWGSNLPKGTEKELGEKELGFKPLWASLVAQVIKNLPANARDLTLIPGFGRSPGGRHGNPLQCSCLENPIDRGAWWGHKESDTMERLNTKTGITAHVPVTLLRRWSEVRVMILGFMHISTMWESEVEGEASKIMDLAFYFSADAKKLAIFSWTPDSSLWPLNFKDKFHVFGGCVHTGFHLTALVWFPMPFATLGERRKEEGKTKERRGWRLKTWKDF